MPPNTLTPDATARAALAAVAVTLRADSGLESSRMSLPTCCSLLGPLKLSVGCASVPKPPSEPQPAHLLMLWGHGIDEYPDSFAPLECLLRETGPELYVVRFPPTTAKCRLGGCRTALAAPPRGCGPEPAPSALMWWPSAWGRSPRVTWLQELGGPEHVRRFVSISWAHCSPFTGWLFRVPNVEQLHPGIPFPNALESSLPRPGQHVGLLVLNAAGFHRLLQRERTAAQCRRVMHLPFVLSFRQRPSSASLPTPLG